MELFSLTDIKKKNLSDIYHYIYQHPNSSKQAIATALGISLPTVTHHLTTLLNESLIETCGQLTSTVGRRATAYCIITTAKIAIGIEILPKIIYITALNLRGVKENKEKYEIRFTPAAEYFIELKDCLLDFLQKYNYSETQILGIGLGIQGLTTQDGSQVTYGKVLDCTGLSIHDFSKYFSVPCRFLHDAECASNSELWENKDIKDAIYLSLGYHLGGAIIVNGELQRGLTGKSGTFEHMTLVPGGLTCYCGKKGCAESYCSGAYLLDEDMDFEDFFSQISAGNPEYKKRWKDYLYHLSILINNLHMVIECTVILGGHITPYFTEDDISCIRDSVAELSVFGGSTEYIVSGRCRNDAVSIGAALPFIKSFLNSICETE